MLSYLIESGKRKAESGKRKAESGQIVAHFLIKVKENIQISSKFYENSRICMIIHANPAVSCL